MRVVAQRVHQASVSVDQEIIGQIGNGLLLLVSAGENDTQKDMDWMVKKIVHLRVFADEQDKMNRSVLDIGGELLAVSQFTLHGDCRKGHRPSFAHSMSPDRALTFFNNFVDALKVAHSGKVQTGQFGAMMDVSLINDGPVTLLLDSEKTF